MAREAAPSFALAGENGTVVTHESLRSRPALLLFVPSAFTPICSREVREHAAELAPLRAAGDLRVVLVSCDTAHTLAAWCTDQGVAPDETWLVGSDFWPHGAVASTFGAFDAGRGWASRTSVLLDAAGAEAWRDASPSGVARDPGRVRRAVVGLLGRER